MKNFKRLLDKKLAELDTQYEEPKIVLKNLKDKKLSFPATPIISSKEWARRWAVVNAWLMRLTQAEGELEYLFLVEASKRKATKGIRSVKGVEEAALEAKLQRVKRYRETAEIAQIALSRDLTKFVTELKGRIRD